MLIINRSNKYSNQSFKLSTISLSLIQFTKIKQFMIIAKIFKWLNKSNSLDKNLKLLSLIDKK